MDATSRLYTTEVYEESIASAVEERGKSDIWHRRKSLKSMQRGTEVPPAHGGCTRQYWGQLTDVAHCQKDAVRIIEMGASGCVGHLEKRPDLVAGRVMKVWCWCWCRCRSDGCMCEGGKPGEERSWWKWDVWIRYGKGREGWTEGRCSAGASASASRCGYGSGCGCGWMPGRVGIEGRQGKAMDYGRQVRQGHYRQDR